MLSKDLINFKITWKSSKVGNKLSNVSFGSRIRSLARYNYSLRYNQPFITNFLLNYNISNFYLIYRYNFSYYISTYNYILKAFRKTLPNSLSLRSNGVVNHSTIVKLL